MIMVVSDAIGVLIGKAIHVTNDWCDFNASSWSLLLGILQWTSVAARTKDTSRAVYSLVAIYVSHCLNSLIALADATVVASRAAMAKPTKYNGIIESVE